MAAANGANDPSTPGGWNKYAYVLGDPVNQTDRHGLYLDASNDWDDCVEDDVCVDGPDQGGSGDGYTAPEHDHVGLHLGRCDGEQPHRGADV